MRECHSFNLVTLIALTGVVGCNSAHDLEHRQTPVQLSSQPSTPSASPALPIFCEQPGCINVYFNKSALTQFASPNNTANQEVNLEQRLVQRLSGATETIDLATYEINLPDVVQALIDRAAAGVRVRVIADAKKPEDADRIERYNRMLLHLERMVRGSDDTVGTNDDIVIFSDSAIFAVEDQAARIPLGLPANANDLPQVTVAIGSGLESGRLLADAEQKAYGGYYSAGNQMHNKFAVVDGTWVFTGSWNFTVTGLYGSDANRDANILGGNQQHAIELHSPELAAIYTTEFNEMWGGSSEQPDPANSNFHGRKTDNTAHEVTIGGRRVEVFFSPGDDALARLRSLIADEAHERVYFTVFAWSDQGMVDALKLKWEDDPDSLEGTLTGFDVRGVFDSSFWNQSWSASVDMTGRETTGTVNNPNTRWKNPAPVFRDAESRKLHSKTMLIDPATDSDPTVVIGSTNWSNNGNEINDENLLIIHDAQIANQFLQEFYARYQSAGGQVP